MSKNFTLATVLLGFLVVVPILLSAQETPRTTPAPPPAPAMPPTAAEGPFRGTIRPEADPRLHAGMREELAMNLREISRLIGQVDPRDTQFLETLRKEQASLVEQLKGFDTPAASAATPAAGLDAADPALPPVQQNINRTPPALDTLPGDPLPPNWQQMSPDELAKVFAEQRRSQPTAMPDRLSPIPPRSGYQPPAPFGAGAPPAFGAATPLPSEGFSAPPVDAMSNRLPWAAQPASQEITELKETITALQKQIEQMRAEVKALDTQMQLLNQNILLKMSNQPAK